MTDKESHSNKSSGKKIQKKTNCDSLLDKFPGYTPRASGELKEFFSKGLVVLDSNALLDVYRFNEQARSEYLAALSLLEDRLWVPNQVASEFLRNRPDVASDCANANTDLLESIGVLFGEARGRISLFGLRRGFSEGEISSISEVLNLALGEMKERLDDVYKFEFNPDSPPGDDPIFVEISELLKGKIGDPVPGQDSGGIRKEWMKRLANRVPPGYMDERKGEGAIGDYLMWIQTIDEARGRGLPVLIVTNEQKEDWVHLSSKGPIGPRSELIVEMKEKAGQEFHLLTVRDFLLHAKEYLSAQVSESTVDRAWISDIELGSYGSEDLVDGPSMGTGSALDPELYFGRSKFDVGRFIDTPKFDVGRFIDTPKFDVGRFIDTPKFDVGRFIGRPNPEIRSFDDEGSHEGENPRGQSDGPEEGEGDGQV